MKRQIGASAHFYSKYAMTVKMTVAPCSHTHLLKHRHLSISMESVRAIPTEVLIGRVRVGEYEPAFTGKRSGMKGCEVSDEQRDVMRAHWSGSAHGAATYAERLRAAGASKEVAARVLEPYLLRSCVVTGTWRAWHDFVRQRSATGVQEEDRLLASYVRAAWPSRLEFCESPKAEPGYLSHSHTPAFGAIARHYGLSDVSTDEDEAALVMASLAARESYGGEWPRVVGGSTWRDEQIERALRLWHNGHLVPFEHTAWPPENLESVPWSIIEWSARHSKRFQKSITKMVRAKFGEEGA